jgi:hypothetical protein
MTGITLKSPSIFPPGTNVSAYPVSNWPAHVLQPSGAPVGSAAANGGPVAVASDGTLAFPSLAVGTYWAVGQVGSTYRYAKITVGQDLDPSHDVEHASLVDAKGDVLTATADNTPARVAVSGTDGRVFQEDSTQATGNKFGKVLETAMETAGNGLAKGAFSAYRHAALNIAANGVATALAADTEDLDVSNWFDTATGKYTPQVPGYYRIAGMAIVVAIAAFKQVYVMLYKNGAAYKTGSLSPQSGGAGNAGSSGSWIAQANGTTDYFELMVFQTDTVVRALSVDFSNNFCGELIGRS